MMLDLDTLRCNLIELHHWASRTTKAPLDSKEPLFKDFVSNKACDRIYTKNHWLGHVWRFYWWIKSFSLKRDPIPEHVEITIQKTISAFKKFHDAAAADNQEFLDTFFSPKHDESYETQAYRKLKQRIHKFYAATHPFWMLRSKDLSEKAKHTLEYIYKKLPPKPHFLSEHLVRLEALTGTLLPMGPMIKMAKDEHINHLEELHIKHYLDRLKKQRLKVPFKQEPPPEYLVKVRFFHRALKETLAMVNKLAPSSRKVKASLPLLEIALAKRGFTLFEQVDAKYMAWRDGLTGQKVILESKELKVGQRIGRKSRGVDRHAYYELPEEPNLLLKTGVNEAHLYIEHETILSTQYGIQHVNHHSWDSKQRYVFVDRIKITLKEIAEQYSKCTDKNALRGMRFLYPIRDLIETLKNLYATPDPLKIEAIGFTARGALRTFVLLKRTNYSFARLENFTHECSLKDQEMYVGLMLGSRMHSASQIEFYDSVLENTLNGDSFNIFWASLKHLEFNDELRARAEKFAKEVKLKHELCESLLIDKFVIRNPEKMKSVLDYCFSDYHKKKCVGSYLCPTLVDDICHDVVEILRLKPKV